MDVNNKTVHIGAGFILLLAAVILIMGIKETFMMLAAALLHELGHIAAISLCGIRIDGISAGHSGIEIKCGGNSSYFDDALIAAAGPMASLLAALLSSLAGKIAGIDTGFFTGINTLYCLFNLLPVSALDGGKVMSAAAMSAFGPLISHRISVVSDVFFCTALFVSGVVALVIYHNPTLVICASVLINGCCKSLKSSVEFYR